MDKNVGDNALPKAGQQTDDDIETVSTRPTSEIAPLNTSKKLHTDLWNHFLKTISNKHESVQRKYPNPDVPEFQPRSTSYFNACANSLERSSQCLAYNTNVIHPKASQFQKDIVLTRMSQQCFADMNIKNIVGANYHLEPKIKLLSNPCERDLLHDVTRYYWTFHEPLMKAEHIPRCLDYKPDPTPTQIDPPDVRKKTSLQNELSKKDKQLIHLNSVVKALLEEIWKVNESLLKYKNKEQWKNDMTFAINEFLKPSTELGFHCDDCCDKFKDFIIKIFKQQERKVSKQQAHYKTNFIDYIVSIIENSLESLTKSCVAKDDFKMKLRKQDASTQTDGDLEQKSFTKRTEVRKAKQQMTKIYRNRNFYKLSNIDSNWYQYHDVPFISQSERTRNKMIKHFVPPLYSPQILKSSAFPTVQPFIDSNTTTNPIQLIHQKFKNLNCRLEGIPDKNLVKFSYIVNGKEYSAIASTKKEAQYHCAWHVLGATKHE